MKLASTLLVAFAFAFAAGAAEKTLKISDVHLCCKSCVTGVQKAVAEVPGASASADQDAGTVTLTGPDMATLKKAAEEMIKAGYFGKSEDKTVNLVDETGAKGEKVQTLKIEGVHLCCGKCVKAVDQSLKSVAGVKGHTATKGAASFEVTGDFNDKEVFTALQKEGLSGRIAK